jgi:SAM-dependent methyltransferase
VEPRDAEIARYEALYARHGTAYRTTACRLALFRTLLLERPDLVEAGLLDVGAGHGTMLAAARDLGYAVAGVEAVASLAVPPIVLAPAWALPFAAQAFGTVTCFDVLEHLLEADVPSALREIGRVARRRILVEVSCRPSNWRDEYGQLHMTIWSPDRWVDAARSAWPGWTVEQRTDRPLERGAALLAATRAA